MNQLGFLRCVVDYPVFYNRSIVGMVFLIVYVDYVIITDSDQKGTNGVKASFCKTKFMPRI